MMSTETSGMAFAALLRHFRLAAGLTQEELAERAHLSVRGVNDLERGARRAPRKDTVQLLAEALALSAAERAAFEAAARAGQPEATQGARIAPPPASERREFPLVGRTRELALLEGYLAGQDPPVLLLAGEPGIGKTRLLQAATQRALRQGWRVLAGRLPAARRPGALRPLLQALQRTSGARGRRSCGRRCRAAPGWCACCPNWRTGPIAPLPGWTCPRSRSGA